MTMMSVKLSGLFRKCCKISHALTWRHCSYRAHLEQYGGGSVHCEKDSHSGIAVITLDHVEKKNALSGTMMVQLSDIIGELEEWTDGKGVILCGAGGMFCSGADLKFIKAMVKNEQGMKMCQFMQSTLQRLFHLPLLSVALLENMTVGGGAELAVSCDLRLATLDSHIGFVQSRMGVSPGFGGGQRLVEIVGRSQALQLLCSGSVLNAEQAKQVGLVDAVLNSNTELLVKAHQWLLQQVPNSASASRVAKQVVLAAMCNAGLEEEGRLFGSLFGATAHQAAMSRKINHRD